MDEMMTSLTQVHQIEKKTMILCTKRTNMDKVFYSIRLDDERMKSECYASLLFVLSEHEINSEGFYV